jgi:hypothetical protein
MDIQRLFVLYCNFKSLVGDWFQPAQNTILLEKRLLSLDNRVQPEPVGHPAPVFQN